MGGAAGAAWGIASSFSALESAEVNGIEAVASGLEFALIITILFTFTAIAGIIQTSIGVIKATKFSKRAE